jgi:hypothetical protein
MSTLKKTLFFVGALIWMSYGAATIDLNSTLVFDDFDDAYGDAPAQSTLGAAKASSENKSASSGGYGFWYIVVPSVPYGYVVAGVSTHDTIGTTNTKNLNDGHILHFLFKLNPDTSASGDEGKYPSAEVSNTFYKEKKKDSIDLSKMTALSFKAKGTGTIWVGFMAEKILRINSNAWGTMGDTVSLKAAMTSYSIPISKLRPIPYSEAETGNITWSQCANNCCGFQIKSWNSKNAEVSIDSIVFEGVKYSDVMAKVGVRESFNIPSSYSNAAISVNNAVVSYTANQTQNVSISLFNANGKEIGNLYTGNASVGTHSVALPKSIIPGTYFVRMNNAQGLVSHKFTIVK